MSAAKLSFTIGTLSFSAEGEPAWLEEQMDRLLSHANLRSTKGGYDENTAATRPDLVPDASVVETGPLAREIRSKGGSSNQVRRFLIVADWLRRRGEQNLTTTKVADALAANHQKGLSNPSQRLNDNVTKGFCEKTDGGFFITPDGLASLKENAADPTE